MRLKSLTYIEFEGRPLEWRLDGLSLGPINLIVGKNATGKSRTLNVISSLAGMLLNQRKPTLFSADYDVVFEDEDRILRYELKIEERKVLREKLTINRVVRLERGNAGKGHIFAEKIGGGTKVRFQTPQDELAAVARRDTIQHSFLQPLFDWGSSLKHYRFGTALGQNVFAVSPEKKRSDAVEGETDVLLALLRNGIDAFGEKKFKKAIIKDMLALDYPIDDVGLTAPVSFQTTSGTIPDLECLYVQEKDLGGITDQNCMSQGMFRALAILIYTNYAQLSKKLSCVLIDDIGEGLDFDRSCRLIDLLRKKSEISAVQLILSTNDRFVMNKVPLEEWSLLQRRGSHVNVHNYSNSREHFERFKFMGLNNFDFLRYDFINEDSDNVFEPEESGVEA